LVTHVLCIVRSIRMSAHVHFLYLFALLFPLHDLLEWVVGWRCGWTVVATVEKHQASDGTRLCEAAGYDP